MQRLSRLTVSRSFRDAVLTAFPALAGNLTWLRLMQYLLFGADRDDQQRLLLSVAHVGAVAGASAASLHWRNFAAEPVLRAFQEEVMSPASFRWSDWSDVDGLCRVVTRFDPGPLVRALLPQELARDRATADERVYFDTGAVFSTKAQRAERRATADEAAVLATDAVCAEAQRLLDYLNGLPVTLYTKHILPHLPEARALVATLSDPEPARTERVRDHAYGLLNAIEDQPQPFYRPSSAGRTVRVFGYNASFLGLNRQVRKVLTQEFHAFDLRSSQLAICARAWGVQKVCAFLAGGGNLWADLFAALGLDYAAKDDPARREQFEQQKALLKEAVYALLFGMAVGAVQRRLTSGFRAFGIRRAGPRFRETPLMGAMLEARERALAAVEQAGFAVDCFERRLVLTPAMDARSILAQLAQAQELQLMLPILDLAEQHPAELQLPLWLHDGVCVHIHDRQRARRWVARITEAVNQRATELRIPTVLEYEPPRQQAA